MCTYNKQFHHHFLVNPDVVNERQVKGLEKLIEYQKKVLKSNMIPAKFKPRQLLEIAHPAQQQIEEAFLKEYEYIFQRYLSSAIEMNDITLSIKKARLQSTSHTEVKEVHHQPCIQEVNSTHRGTRADTTSGTTATQESTSIDKPSRSTITRKRKRTPTKHQPKKQLKMECFLVKGSQESTNTS